MIMLDRWSELASRRGLDKHTVEACRALADEMCQMIFHHLGFTVQVIDSGNALRVVGRGLSYIIPTTDHPVSLRSANPPRAKLPTIPRLRQMVKKPEGRAMAERAFSAWVSEHTRLSPKLLSTMFSRLLSEHPVVKVHFMDHKKLVIPETVRPEQNQCTVFEYGLNLPIPINDLELTDSGISATLSFSRTFHHTFVPWEAVALFSFPDGGSGSPPPPKPKSRPRLSFVP